ncbi:MAG: trypsin-like peptidase domain-containing protein [Isosphaeraceae bacterium]
MIAKSTPLVLEFTRGFPRVGTSFLVLGLAIALAPSSRADAQDQGAAQEDQIRNAVVKITATMRPPDPVRPWTKQSPRDASGTGVIIEGNRILTNAHVVAYASQLFVESNASSDKLVATVEALSPGIDLAVLKLEDESFFENRRPLPHTHKLPGVKDTVLAYGYPTGGSTLSITKGIVSRIEFAPYGDQVSGLRVQVDAAINPGNSGGPAIIDGQVVGLIFSRLSQADNIGYIIPSEEIDLFLDDLKDGRLDGKPALFDQLQTLENDALRPFLKLDRKATGIIVHRPDDANSPLREWDLITKIGDAEVDNTGMVKVAGEADLRLRFQYLIQKLATGGKVPLTVIREGEEVKIDLPVKARRPALIDSLRGRYPSYFVYGPLVFSPVTAEFLAGFDRAGNQIYALLGAIGSPLVLRRGDTPAFDGEELVVVSAPMFPHRVSKGYSNPMLKVVKEINGVKVKNLRHLVELLRDAKETFTTISFDDRGSETIVFPHRDALAATEDVLNDNGIRQRASDDVLAVWEGKDKDRATPTQTR